MVKQLPTVFPVNRMPFTVHLRGVAACERRHLVGVNSRNSSQTTYQDSARWQKISDAPLTGYCAFQYKSNKISF